MERVRSLGRESEQPRPAQAVQATVQVGVALERRVLVIIQPGAAQALVIQLEAQRLDQVQAAAVVGAEADNVAGFRRNFRLEKDHMEHAQPQL
jgi:hypothetical protein